MKKRRKKNLTKYMVKEFKLKWHIPAIVVALFIFSFFIADVFKSKILYSDIFVIEEVIVKGNILASSEEILGDAEIVYETPFFVLDNKMIEKNIRRNSRINRAIVTKKFPNVVEIFVEEKKSIALVTLDRTYELASDGTLMKLKIRESDLPFVTGFTSLTLLTETEIEQFRKEMEKVVKLLNELENIDKNFLNEFSEIQLTRDEEYIAYLRNGMTRVLFGRGDLYKKGINLYSLLKSNKNELNCYNEIDLRYKNLAYAR